MSKFDICLWRLLERYVKDEDWKAETVFVLSFQLKKLFRLKKRIDNADKRIRAKNY